ncbi:hypothetical protein RND81_10G099800 [Saponaria officinalis]|uniref:Uncharacterized protein n=1 Tax=Saponaria officinalis TaxID=3572 RepID=A0AAW1I2M6_SAPOF
MTRTSRGPKGAQGFGQMKKNYKPTAAKVVNQSRTQQKRVAKHLAIAARSRFDRKLQQEAMVAELRAKEQEHQNKIECLKEESLTTMSRSKPPTEGQEKGSSSKGKRKSADDKKLDECTSALGKLNDTEEGEYEDDMEGISGDDLDLIVIYEDLKAHEI